MNLNKIFEFVADKGDSILFTIKNNKPKLLQIGVFIISLIGIFALSQVLTEISFLDRIDATNPGNVGELQPSPDRDLRRFGLIAIITFFVAIGTIIGRWQGFGAILGMILSMFTIYQLIVPLILIGWPPVVVTLIAGTIIISISLLISHGFKYKTLAAITGGFISLIATFLIGEIFIYFLDISGYLGEDVYTLLTTTQRNFDMQGIVISGIVLAGIGLLDDMTVTQSSIVQEIILLNPKLTIREIYKKAMNIGRDHVGAVINSLFWAYAATSLPILMLYNFFEANLIEIKASEESPYFEIIENITNSEFILEEVLRTIASSTGLILAIPITTFIAAVVLKKFNKKLKEDNHTHSHIH